MHDVGGFSEELNRIRVPAWWKFMRRWAPKPLMRWMAERRMPKELRETHTVVWVEGVCFLVPRWYPLLRTGAPNETPDGTISNEEIPENLEKLDFEDSNIQLPTRLQISYFPPTVARVLNAKEFFSDKANLLLRNTTGGWLQISDMCVCFSPGDIRDFSYELDDLPMKSADLIYAVHMGWLAVTSSEEYDAHIKEAQIRYELAKTTLPRKTEGFGKKVERVD